MSFAGLPYELVHAVLEHLTASDIAALQLVNSRLKEAVECYPQYTQLITINSLDPKLLPKITSQQLDRFYSVREIIHSVAHQECHRCGNLSEILYLPLMKRLCFYCFWISDYSRLIRRYVAKEYYALTDEELLPVPFFANSWKGTFQRQKKSSLNDLCPEVLVSETALKLYGSLDQMRQARNLKYQESQRLHWKSDPRQLLPTAPEAPEEQYEYWVSVEKRYKEDVIHVLGKFDLNEGWHLEVVTCHLCVLNAHRMHQRCCPESTPLQPRCGCRIDLGYELYPLHGVDSFLGHLKTKHLEYYERFRDIVSKMSVLRRTTYEHEKDVWEVQRLIREVYGMADDLSL